MSSDLAHAALAGEAALLGGDEGGDARGDGGGGVGVVTELLAERLALLPPHSVVTLRH